MRRTSRLLSAALLGVLAAVLVSCGSSGAGLIPAQEAGPLLHDFQAVEAAAKTGNGDCASTEAALATTEGDYRTLPSSVDAGLRARLEEGISHLHERALALCTQPLAQTTTTGTTSTTQTPAPPPATTTTETPTTTGEQTSTTGTGASTTPSATTPSGTEGGTAPGVGNGEGQAGEGGGPAEGARNGGGALGGTGSGGTGSGGGSGSGGNEQ